MAKIIDWEAIEREYRAGSLSVSEISKHHDVTHQGIFKRAKKLDWKRDLSAEVRKRINQKLVADSVADNNVSDEEVANAAATRGMQVIKLQRGDIANLRRTEQSLMDELNAAPTKLYLSTYRGEIIEKVVGLTAYERSMATQALAQVQHKRIQLERQAYNLDDTGKDAGDALADLLKSIAGQGRSLPGVMMKEKISSGAYPTCSHCGSRHPQGAAHIYKDEPKKKKIADIVSRLPVKVASEFPVKSLEKAAKPAKKSLEIVKTVEKSLEMRRVSITEIYRNASAELQALPFEITKGGKVVAVVIEKGEK